MSRFIFNLYTLLFLFFSGCLEGEKKDEAADKTLAPGYDIYITYSIHPDSRNPELFWKDHSGNILGNIKGLKDFVESEGRELLFAMNGGMFNQDQSPQGLFIHQSKTITPLDTASGYGNFYLKPNGVFYLRDDNRAFISTTPDFEDEGNIRFATQSGPMLLIDGQMHPAFNKGSDNVHIRNGVGIQPDGKIIFAMSKEKVNFYDFATFFSDAGCKDALYLDGFVSRTYLPEAGWIQEDGELGVMIGVTKPMDD